MAEYPEAVTSALSPEFLEILRDSRVPENVAKWLVEKKILTACAFADLADTKNQIVQDG